VQGVGVGRLHHDSRCADADCRSEVSQCDSGHSGLLRRHGPYSPQCGDPASALVEWKVPFATLTYDGGLHQSSMYQQAGANGTAPSVTICLDPLKSRTQQHEVRISNATNAFKYVAGLYYFQEHQVWDVFVKPAIALLMPYEEQDSKAAFAQGTYAITDVLRITTGGRYTRDHKTRTGGNYGYDANQEPTVLLLPNFADIRSSKFNYRLGVDYDVGPSSMAYASYATGYKAGGFFDGTPPNNTYAREMSAPPRLD
jgi:iron complex outermembrane receptor protein